MDTSAAFVRSLDDAPSQLRELPQLQGLRIAPLRQPVSSRVLSVPSPLEPNASGAVEPSNLSKTSPSGGQLPANLPTLTELLNAARTNDKKDPSVDSLLNLETPPKPILPAFVNLRALERFPYSSFHEDTLHVPRKRRRVDAQTDSFGEHLQLPIPQAQKEQRPPPFGPFAILNGLNEPPPNAALLPPIESGSLARLLTRPTEHGSVCEPIGSSSKPDPQQSEKREGRIDEVCGSPVDKGGSHDLTHHKLQSESDPSKARRKSPTPPKKDDVRLSPKRRGRSRKNLRKWTEEETAALLRGVIKCGIGNWTAILAQPELKFNKRSASNLKDRFRVCCPWAYQASDINQATKQLRDTFANALLRAETGRSGGKLRLANPQLMNSGTGSGTAEGNLEVNVEDQPKASMELTSAQNGDSKDPEVNRGHPPSPESTESSTKSESTFESLGIPEPHISTKSRRRSRRPFTAAEDDALLKGHAIHGFQWTLIQQDKSLNLGHRKATHLRDRFRTKFPHAYRAGGPVYDKTLQNNTTDDGTRETTKQIPVFANHLKSNNDNNNNNDSNDNDNDNDNNSDNDGGHRHNIQSSLGSGVGGSGLGDSGFPSIVPQGLLEPPFPSLATASTSTAVAVFQLSAMDEKPATTAITINSAIEAATWGDNTLPPMTWDELG